MTSSDDSVEATVDRIESIIHPEGRCVDCGGGKHYWKHTDSGRHPFRSTSRDSEGHDHEPNDQNGCSDCHRLAIAEDRRDRPTSRDSEVREAIFDCWVHGNEPCDDPAPMYADPTAEEVAAAKAHGSALVPSIERMADSENYKQGVFDGGVAMVNRLLREGKLRSTSRDSELREAIEAIRDLKPVSHDTDIQAGFYACLGRVLAVLDS